MNVRGLSGLAVVGILAGCQGNVAVGGDAGGARDAGSGRDASTVSPRDASADHATACVPGQSVACVGPGGCATNQVCESDGSGFGACTCTVAADASPPRGDAGHTTACVPGQSVACTGPGGCATNQVCATDGSGFGACNCASPPDAATKDAAVADATTATDATTALCVPGQSIACAGSGGCISSQVCNAAGSAYGACSCTEDGGTTLSCIPGQSIACGGPYGCVSSQVCNATGDAYGPCDCPDAASYLDRDASSTPDGYAPLPPPVGNQGYNAIWSASALRLYLPLFSAASCDVIPPYGETFVVSFIPSTNAPVGTYSSTCSGTPCYSIDLSQLGSNFSVGVAGEYTLSAFNAAGIATGQMDTAQGIVPLVVKNCD